MGYRLLQVMVEINRDHVIQYFIKHNTFGLVSSLFKRCPIQQGKHISDTIISRVVITHKTGSPALNLF